MPIEEVPMQEEEDLEGEEAINKAEAVEEEVGEVVAPSQEAPIPLLLTDQRKKRY